MQSTQENPILDNQAQIDSTIMKKVRLTREQYRKLEIMIPFYYNDSSKIEASSFIVGEALEYYFQNKYVEDIKKL